MKLVEVPFHYYPDAVGGTEVYTASLTRELMRLGMEVEIAALGAAEEQYVHDGVPVHRFAPRPAVDDLSELYGTGDPAAAEQFRRILDRTQPDLVHLHAMSPAVSLLAVVQCLQFEYGAFSTQTRFLLGDYYALLSENYWIGKIYPAYVDFRPYDWTMEDFRFANYCGVSKLRPDLRNVLARNGEHPTHAS